jgi:hypothetical protein
VSHPSPPPMEPVWIALAMSMCDILTTEIAKVQALVGLLEKKGLLSASEIQNAIHSIPPESVERISESLRKSMQERVAIRYQEVLLHTLSDSPTQ